VHAKLAQVEQYGVFTSGTPHQPAMPKGQPQQDGHSKPSAARIWRDMDSTQAQNGVMNRNHPRGRCLQSSHLERNLYKYDLMLLAPKGSALAMSMMVIRIEAVYATFSDAQTLARYILDLMMNGKTSSSSMGWIPRTRKYSSSTFKSFLDTTQSDLAGRPVPPSQQPAQSAFPLDYNAMGLEG
jgi:hypothetical protein